MFAGCAPWLLGGGPTRTSSCDSFFREDIKNVDLSGKGLTKHACSFYSSAGYGQVAAPNCKNEIKLRSDKNDIRVGFK